MKQEQPSPPNERARPATSQLLTSMATAVIGVAGVEARLFGHTVLSMIGLTMVIALLIVGSCLFAGVAIAMVLADLQAFSMTSALLTVAFAHVLLAGLAFWRRRHITRDLSFNESRASIDSLLLLAQAVREGVAAPGNPERDHSASAQRRTHQARDDI